MTPGIEYDEGGLPVHLGIPVNARRQGPLDRGDPSIVGWMCWCGDMWCTKFLRNE